MEDIGYFLYRQEMEQKQLEGQEPKESSEDDS